MEKDCIFCKIIRSEIPSKKYYEDNNFLAIFDIAPIANSHIVLMSKTHYDNVGDMNESEWQSFMNIARMLAEKIVTEIGADGYNILVNQGEAGQSLVNHRPHCHIIPRFLEDGIKIDPRG